MALRPSSVPLRAPLPSPTATATAATASATATATVTTATTAAHACCAAMASLRVLAFDHEGRPIQFDTCLDDLQWLTRDAAARLAIRNHLQLAECTHFGQHRTAQALYNAVVARYSSPATAALGRLLLPYLFPELSTFATVEDLVPHLRSSDTRYRATVPAEFLDRNQPPMFITLYFIVTRLPDSLRSVRDHFPSLDPTSLIVDLLEQHIRAAETSALAVGAAHGTPRPPFFEGTLGLLLLVRIAAAARARVAGLMAVAAGVVVGAAVEAVEVVAAVGVVEGVGALVAAVEAAVGVAVVAAVGLVAAGLELGVVVLEVARGSSSSVGARPSRPSSFTCGSFQTQHRWFSRLDDAWRSEFGDEVERPRWEDLLRSGFAIFALDFDAILTDMYALSVSAEGDCYRCVPPDPGIVAAALGAIESALPGTVPAEALHTFTLDSGASRCFFRDSTTLTPLSAPIPVRLADPSGGPDVARSSNFLPCSAVPSGSLSGLHLPSFSTNLVSTAALQDSMVTTTTPGGQRVSIFTCTRTGRHLATFTHRPELSPYTLATKSPQVAASAQGSLPPLPPSPAPPCLPCVDGWQRAAPHSSSFPPTTAPLQTLHMDVWGPARISGQGRERYILLIRAVRLQLHERFGQDLLVLRLHSDRGVMGVACTSMIHAAAPHFLWPFAVRYAAHQLNLWPRVSLPETSPTLRWTGEVGDASVFRVAGDSGAARGIASGGAKSGGAEPGGADSEGAGSGGAEPRGDASSGGAAGASPRLSPRPEILSPQQLREWLVRRARLWSGAAGAGGTGDTGAGGAGATDGTSGFGGTATTGPGDARTRGTGAAGTGGVGFVGAGDPTEPGAAGTGGTGAGGTGARGAGAGGPGVGGAGAGGARAVDPGAVVAGARGAGGTGAGGTVQPRPFFIPLLQQVLGVPSSASLTPPLLCPLPDCPTVSRLLEPVVIDPSFESAVASALVAELLDFAAACRLDCATSLVAESKSTSPPSIGLAGSHGCRDGILEVHRHLRQRRVKRPPGSPPAFKARYIARGFSQRQGVDYFQTFSPTPKMTTLRVLLHVAAQRDYELHSLDFSTAFLQGSLHKEIWLRRPPGFTGSFPAGTQWSLRRPVYVLRQAPREWHDTLRTTFAALGFAPSTGDPLLFLHIDTSLPPFYVLVYIDDLVFATADTEALTLANSKLQRRHTCTDLGELRSHSLSTPPLDESVEPSGPYPELMGCLMYLMTCTRPDLAYPFSLLARYVAPSRHGKVLRDAAKRVLRYLCSTSGMGLVLGGRVPVVLTGHTDSSWVDSSATQRSSQGYTFSLCSCSVSWRSTRSSSVLSSSCEVEIYAGAMAAQELRWLTYLLTDLREQPRSPLVLYVDNKAMIALCQEHRLEHQTKHIALRYFLARELQQRGQIHLAYVATRANTADIFTKALPPGDHQRFSTALGLVLTLPHLLIA
ncbi:unnamed protein product [Closterium sp. NIES-54]